jgi:hypothetical protein
LRSIPLEVTEIERNMTKLELQLLKNDLFKAEKELVCIEAEYGKASLQYQEALKRFARLWAVLKMSRPQEEFLREAARTPALV